MGLTVPFGCFPSNGRFLLIDALYDDIAFSQQNVPGNALSRCYRVNCTRVSAAMAAVLTWSLPNTKAAFGQETTSLAAGYRVCCTDQAHSQHALLA